MPRVQHPAFPEIFSDVTDETLGAHLDAGWLECPGEIDGQAPPVDPSPAGRGSNTTPIGPGRVSERDAR